MVGGLRVSKFVQRLHGDRDHTQSFSRLLEFPASYGDHAVRLQVFEIFAKCFSRIKIVLAEGERSRGGRRPGIHQRHLHHVITVSRITDKRAAVGDVQTHIGALI